jgi:hypothetical protein
MTCSDVERVLPEFLDGAPEGAFPDDFETHVKSCPACSDLVSDLKLIASEARQLAATEEPAPRVWVRIAAELRAEGLIHDRNSEPESIRARPVLVPTYTRRRWNAWWMAPVAAAILAAGSYVVSHKPASPVAKQQVPAPQATSPAPVIAATPVTPSVAPTRTPAPVPQQLAQNTVTQKPAERHDVESASDPEDQQFLSVVSTLSPSMRVTYENQLQALNADIQETQAYVNRNPGDADARQHLMGAYQQKALLYQIALDRIQ